MTAEQAPSQYSDGYTARINGSGREACTYGVRRMEKRHWWLAGFHDADIELGVSVVRWSVVHG